MKFIINPIRRSRRLGVALLCLLPWCFLSAQAEGSQSWPYQFRILSDEPDFPNVQVEDALLDQNKILWLKTLTGLVEYNGHSYRTWGSEDGLAHSYYKEFFSGPEGKIWLIAGNYQLDSFYYVYDEPDIEILDPETREVASFDDYFGPAAPFAAGDVYRIIQVNDQALLVSTRKGGWKLENGSFQLVFPADRSGRPYLLRGSPGGAIFLQWPDSLVDLSSGRTFPLPLWSDVRIVQTGAFLILKAHFLNKESRPKPSLCYLDFQTGTLSTMDFGCGKRPYYNFRPTRDSGFWIATENCDPNEAVFVDHQGRFTERWIQPPQSFANTGSLSVLTNEVTFITDYRKGKSALFRKHAGYLFFEDFDRPDISLRGIARLNDEELLVCTYDGIFRFRRGGADVGYFVVGVDWKSKGLYGTSRSQGDSLWIGTHANEIVKYDKTSGQFSRLIPPATFVKEANQFSEVFVARDGRKLIGAEHGAFVLEGETFSHLKVKGKDQIDQLGVNCFFERTQDILVGTTGGLFSLRTDSLVRIDLAGLRPQIQYIYQDSSGVYWMPTQGQGLIKWDPRTGQVRRFGQEAGFYNPELHFAAEDSHQNLWIPSNNGLFCFSKTEEKVINYLSEGQLPFEEFNKKSFFVDKDGTLYLGGVGGLLFFHPDSLLSNADGNGATRFRFVSISTTNRWSGAVFDKWQAYRATGQIRIQPSEVGLSLTLASSDLLESVPRVLYYRVPGLYPKWEPFFDGKLKVGRVPYGTHRLQISQGIPTDETPALDILLISVRPIYLRGWFLVLVFLVGALLIAYLFRRKQNENQILEEKVALRTQELLVEKARVETQNRRLEAVTETQDRLFAIVGHELRGPMVHYRDLASKVSFLIRKGNFDRLKSLSERLDTTSQAMLGTLENLLYWGMMKSDHITLEQILLNLSQVVEKTTDEFRVYAQHKKVKLLTEIEPALWLHADEPAIQLILGNLITNALKFTEPGREICVRLKKEGSVAVLEVEDEGIGMEKTQLRKLWENTTLATTKGTEGERGTGLGLSLCRELTQLHQGRLFIQSRKQEGTLVKVELPMP